MASNMRGLTQYISDIRACRVRELEEKRINREMAHIRQKFKEGQLDGYQKKKYLAKVVFTYILGYKVDVGHMEAVNLISSPKYSEKQIGYLALTLLMHENSDLVRLVINSIRKDLDDNNEINNCLALHAIATLGGKEMAEALSDNVYRAMVSQGSTTFVRKKAALTLLRLYRKHPSVMPIREWAERIVKALDDPDLGVALTATSVVTAMAQDDLEAFEGCYERAVRRLDRVVFDADYPPEYVYYKVPNPWLQVKLLRLLQYYPPPDNPSILETIDAVIQAIIDVSQETPRNVQHNNAQNAVLFEAINLAIHIDPESTTVHNASVLLGRFILAKETNVRYLGLDAMAHLAACSASLEPVKKHQDTIIMSLKDRDISVRRRALDLLYSMCDGSNSKVIVGELVRYLQMADYNLREEMVLKIAILTERFATEYEWYVDTILQLISVAGDHVGAEVWYRVVQLVTNNEDLQAYAASAVFEHLRSKQVHENMVRVAGYILGEFGHLIANEQGCSPIEQFQALHGKVNMCAAPTRALLLTTYIKWVNLFPEIKDHLINIFERYTHVLDAELQQRACEYLALARRPDSDDLLSVMCDEMPIFPERESTLISRLHSKGDKSQDKRTWVIGGAAENISRQGEKFRAFRKDTAGSSPVDVKGNGSNGGGGGSAARGPPVPEKQSSQASSSLSPNAAGSSSRPPVARQESLIDDMMGPSGGADDIMSSLADLDLTGTGSGMATQQQQQPLLNGSTDVRSSSTGLPSAGTSSGAGAGASAGGNGYGAGTGQIVTSPMEELSEQATHLRAEADKNVLLATLGGVAPALVAPLTKGPNVEKWFERLTYSAEGVLYEDAQVQIGLKSEYHGHKGRLAIFIGNKLPTPLTNLACSLDNPCPEALSTTFHDAPVTTIQPLEQVQELVHLECREPFTEPPVIRVTYLSGSFTTLVLRLPVVLSKFVEGVELGQQAFFERWKIIGGAPREAQEIFPIRLVNDEIDLLRNSRVMNGLKFSLLNGIDPNLNNLVVAGVLHTSSTGKVGILGRLEPNKEAKMCRLTIRSTNEHVSSELKRLAMKPLHIDQMAS